MILSICIPSITERAEKLCQLLKSLHAQAQGHPVEILALVDNKIMPLADKRNLLIEKATGTFVANLDDDDTVADNYILEIVKAATENLDADVISFDQMAQLGQAIPFRVCTGINHECMPATGTTIFRKPWHWCAWRTELAVKAKFTSAWNEDGLWLGQLWPLVKKECHIDKVLHHYNYNRTTTTFK